MRSLRMQASSLSVLSFRLEGWRSIYCQTARSHAPSSHTRLGKTTSSTNSNVAVPAEFDAETVYVVRGVVEVGVPLMTPVVGSIERPDGNGGVIEYVDTLPST